jgi:hypothetical protein
MPNSIEGSIWPWNIYTYFGRRVGKRFEDAAEKVQKPRLNLSGLPAQKASGKD